MTTEWHLVLGRDGTVLAAADGAPRSWIGTRLEECDDVPEDLKDAVRGVLRHADQSESQVATTGRLESIDRSVHLTVVEAMPLQRTQTDLGLLLRSTMDLLRRQAKAMDVSLDIIVDPHVPPMLSLDGEKIAWAISVLVGNALRYVRHGTQVMPGGSIVIRATYNSAAQAVIIEVQDDGSGIPADKLPFLFRSPGDRPKTGLGLVMVREVVCAHAGHVEVESSTDPFRHGTRIRLTVPAL